MELVAGLVAQVGMTFGGLQLRRRSTRRREDRLREGDAFRLTRRAADDDVARFGEELTGLHEETLTSSLDEAMRADYQRALDHYEGAKSALASAESTGACGR